MTGLRLGYLDPFPPFCMTRDGRAEGLFLDLVRAFLAQRRADADFVPGRIDRLPADLAAGRIDAILCKARTAARTGDFGFSAPLMTTAAALFGPAASLPPLPEAAGACRIATPAAGPLAAELARRAPAAEVVAVTDYDAALAAVTAGAADWAALNADAGALAAARHAGRIGPPGPHWAGFGLCIAVRPGDPDGVLPRLGLTLVP